MKKKILITIVLLTALLLPAASTFAQSTIPKPNTLRGPSYDLSTEQGKQGLKEYLPNVFAPHFTKGFTAFAAIFCFFGLVVAGIIYITAYGREDMLTKAKTIAIWSAVGFVISLFSYAIVSIITQIKIN